MKTLWVRHQAGMKHCKNNVFIVEFPSPIPEETTRPPENPIPDELDDEASQYRGIV